MKMRWAWIFPVLSLLALVVAPSRSQSQQFGMRQTAGQPGQALYGAARPASAYDAGGDAGMAMQAGVVPVMHPPAGLTPRGAMPVGYVAAPLGGAAPGLLPGGPPPAMSGLMPIPAGPMPDARGSYGSVPANFGMEVGGMDGNCPYCGGQGCDNCNGADCYGPLTPYLHNTLLGDCCDLILPYPDGGCAAIRWYDFAVDFMHLSRDDVGRNINLASQGIAGPIALSTDELDLDESDSFRFSGAFQIGPGSNLEFTYYGLFQFSDIEAEEDPTDNLFSVFGQFGILGGAFEETNEADFQQISYTSTFDSFETNFRQRWLSPNCRYQGSWLIGIRHFILDEEFRFFSSSSANGIGGDPLNPAQLTDVVTTTNNMTGTQIGGDVWICLIPGMRLGAEGKVGVYGNHMNANTLVSVNTGAADFFESVDGNDVAILADASATLTYRVNYQWTARLAYNVLYVDGVALATENFNTVLPLGPVARVPFANDDGTVFYHGWSAGLEFMW